MNYKKGEGALDLIIVVGGLIVIVVTLLSIVGAVIGLGKPNSGQHTGIVTSVEQEGIIWKTWKVYVKTSPQATQEDQYCVTDPEVVTKLQELAASSTLSTFKYSRGIFIGPWDCAGEPSIINSIK